MQVKSSCIRCHLMHFILIHLLGTELHLQLELFFLILQFIFHIYIRNIIASFSDYFAGLLLYHLLPRTTFVREEASRDEALRTTERRAWNILLPFNSTFILYRVFSTLCARKHLRRYSKMLKQTKKTFL